MRRHLGIRDAVADRAEERRIRASSGPHLRDVRSANAARVHAVAVGAAHTVGTHAGGNRVGIALERILRRWIGRNLEVNVLGEEIGGGYDDNDQYEIDRPHSAADYSAGRADLVEADLKVGPYVVFRNQFTTTSPVTFAAGDGGGTAGLAAAAGACDAGFPSRAFISSSAPANNCSFVVLPASPSPRIAFWAWYSLLTMPALLWSMRHALRRSTQKSTS